MKLFNKNFVLVVIGQIISLFGNAILRFALPLYLLDETGSSVIFGAVMACSFIPMVILSPIGGMLADRLNKRNIMVVLDFGTAVLTVMFLLSVQKFSPVIVAAVVMMVLFGIQAVYQPSVQASMPFLQEPEHLMQANAIVNQISSLAGLLGPIIGGVLYGIYGVTIVVIAAGICFFISAVMEIFIHIPHEKQMITGSVWDTVKSDFSESLVFVKRDQPVIWKVIVIVMLFNLFLTSMVIVGIPVIIRVYLGMSSQALGATQGIEAAGGLIGGILIGVLAKKLDIQKSWKILLGAAASIVPMGLILIINPSVNVTYAVVTAFTGLLMVCATMFSVQMLVFVQAETPKHLVGKVLSVTIALSSCSQPVGQALYGILFDVMKTQPGVIVLFGGVVAAVICIVSRRVFGEIKGSFVTA